jgi:hypothetical protein
MVRTFQDLVMLTMSPVGQQGEAALSMSTTFPPNTMPELTGMFPDKHHALFSVPLSNQ